MITKEEILKILKESKSVLNEKYKIKEVGLFGSYLRGEQKELSDIDILVDFNEGADLFDLVGVSLFLEEKLNYKIDVVPKNALREELRENILRAVVFA